MIPVHHVLEVPGGSLWHIASHRERRPRRGRKSRATTPAMLAARAGLGNFEGLPTICLVGDRPEPLRLAEWQTFAVPDGVPVVFRSRPMGGGGGGGGSSNAGKAIGGAVAMIALAVLAPYAVGAIGAAGAGFLGTVGALTTAGQIAAAVLVAGGGMLISHFMAPKAGGKSETGQTSQSIYNVASQGNRPRPQQTIPVGYGRSIRPLDYAAPPTSVFSNNNQEEWNLFVLGCGDYSVEELRIGDTTVWTSGGGVASGYSGLQIELLPPGTACSLFPTNLIPNTDVSSVTVPQNGSNTAEQVINASGTSATAIYVSLAWSRSYASLSFKGTAYNTAATTGLSIDYAQIDSGGSQVGGWTTYSQSFDLIQPQGYRHTVMIGVAPGRYKIRIRASGLSETNELGLIGVAAQITQDQPGLDQYRIAVKRIAGADQQGLTGTWLSIQTRKTDVWNGTTWVAQANRNPVWAALDIWKDQDYGARQPLTNVDLATMISLATFADQQQYYFDHWFTSQMDLDEALRTCLRVMLAFPVYMLDKLSATYDGVRSAPSMLFTDGEIVRGSLQRGSKLYRNDFADGAILEYLDETTWRAADVKSGDGLNNPGRIQIPGVTRRAQAAWLARRHAAETNYRRVEASWEVEGEAKLLHVGDMVRVATSEPQTFAETLLAQSYNTGTQIITVDRAPAWDDAAASHWIQIRGRNGKPLSSIRCVKNVSNPLQLVLNGSDVSAAEGGGVTLDATINRAGLEDQCAIAFSAGSARKFDVLIKEIRRNGPNRFTISGVVDNALVYDADSGSVSPLPTLPPVVVNAVPVIVRLDARMFQNGPHCMLAASWRGHPGAVRYLAEVSYDGKASWVRIASTLTQPTFQVFVQPADLYLRVAGVSSSGIQGDWTETAELTAPVILISGDVVNLSVGIDDVVGELYEIVAGDGSLTQLHAATDALEARAASLRLALSSNPADNALVTDPIVLGLRDDVNLVANTLGAVHQRLETLRGQLIESGLEVSSAEGRARIFGIAALDNRVNQLSIELNALAGTLTLYASTAISGDLTSVINTLNTVQVQLNSVQASLSSYVTSASLTSTNARVTTLETDMDAAEASIATKAALTTVTDQGARLTTAESAISALGSIINTVTSANVQFTDLDLLHSTLAGVISYLRTVQGEHITQLGIATTNLSAFQDTTNRQIAQSSINLASLSDQTSAQFAQLTQAIADGDSALTSQLTTLSAQVNHVSTGLPATLAALNSEISARASGDSALSTSISSLSAQINHASTGLPAAHSAIASEVTARVAADSALSSSITSLSATINHSTTGLAAAHAAVTTEAAARVSADNALSSSLSTVSSTVNGLTSSVVQFAAAEATPGGYTAAWDLKVSAGATFAGMTVLARADGTSAIKLRSQDFILDDGSPIAPFYVSGGIVYIEEARIKRGAISKTYLFTNSGSLSAQAGDELIFMIKTSTSGAPGNAGATWGVSIGATAIASEYNSVTVTSFGRYTVPSDGTVSITSSNTEGFAVQMIVMQQKR